MTNLKQIQCLVCDLDGTLVDSMGVFADIASQVMHKYYGDPVDAARENYRKTSGNPFPEQLRLIHGDDARNKPAVAEFNQCKNHVYGKLPFFADIKPAFDRFREKDIAVCVSSNNDASNVLYKMKESGLSCDLVLGYEEPGFLKGEKHFQRIEELLDIRREHFLFVGDSLHDGKTAAACGVGFMGRTGTFAREDFERAGFMQTVQDFLQLVDKLEKKDLP